MEVYERLGVVEEAEVNDTLVLDHEQRDKGRLRLTAATGAEVRIFLDRGNPLRVGELLRTLCGKNIRVEGAPEPVAVARCDDWPTFARACYHLGNRHVKVAVGDRELRIKPDHVLEEMLVQLGLSVAHETAVFVPESGAYGRGHHHHHG